jgi:hypothetical protein
MGLCQEFWTEGVLVTRSCAIDVSVIENDFFKDQIDQPDLFGIQFLDNAGFNPNPLFHLCHLIACPFIASPVPVRWHQRECNQARPRAALDLDNAFSNSQPVQKHLFARLEEQCPAGSENMVLPGSSGSILLPEIDITPPGGAPFACRRRPVGALWRAYSQGRGESVTRCDRRRRELEVRSPSPPLARPCESDGAGLPFLGETGHSPAKTAKLANEKPPEDPGRAENILLVLQTQIDLGVAVA